MILQNQIPAYTMAQGNTGVNDNAHLYTIDAQEIYYADVRKP